MTDPAASSNDCCLKSGFYEFSVHLSSEDRGIVIKLTAALQQSCNCLEGIIKRLIKNTGYNKPLIFKNSRDTVSLSYLLFYMDVKLGLCP
jgi:hypothetical protein